MLSQQISTSSRSNSRNRNVRSVSAGRRFVHDRQAERRNTEGIKANKNNSVDMSNVEMALRIIEESQGKKLPRVKSLVDVNKAKSVSSSTAMMAPGPAPQRPERHPVTSKVLAAGGGNKSKLRTPSPPPSRVKSPPQKVFDHEGSFHSRRRSSTTLSQHGYDSSEAPSFRNDSQPASKRGSINDMTESSGASDDRNSSNASGVRDNRAQPPLYKPPPTRPSPPPLPPPPQQNVQQYPPPSPVEQIPYELPMKNNDEWRKYQVKGKMNEKQESAEQHNQFHHHGHEQPPPIQPSEGDDQSWLQYKVKDGKREKQRSSSAGRSVRSSGSRKSDVGDGDKKSSKMFGQPKRNASERSNVKSVKQMPYTDQFGDFGFYTGHVNDDSRPDGKGTMKYENGVFYEGTWTDGCQDQKAAANYERIRGGFTSWSGKGKQATKSGMVLPWNARKNDVHNDHEKTNVRGMEWTDLNGDSGRYTGEVNNDQLPHGRGIMKYDFGLIAEGEFVNGVLKENPHDRMISAAASGMSVAGMSVGPMSVVGPMSTAMSVGPMSVGPMSV